jgi:two-component system cell cycle response regulator DivK
MGAYWRVGHPGWVASSGEGRVSDELVLIIEDNEKNLKLSRDLLQVKGFRTIEAMTAGSGIALAVEHRPDAVLMDIQLPDMDGGEALARLRADGRTAAIPVIAVTAFAMAGDRERFLAAGFDAYVTKPIDVRSFPGLVGSFCGRVR